MRSLGEWTRRMVVNPEYLAAKELNEEKIRNPRYKGSWEEQQAKKQPLRKEDGNAYLLDGTIGAIGIEIISVMVC